MIQLFLSEPTWSDKEDEESLKQILSLLTKLETIVWSLISSGGRSEARLWLCNTVSGISSITPRNQLKLFVNLLRSKPLKRGLATQLLQMIFEKKPHKAGAIIAKKSHVLENFFRGHPKRILQWFSSFAESVELEHRKGAKALSQFAFVNRDICWEELVWKGKHGQSPAMVATKPHYFNDLDILQTVENFLEFVPEFWSSIEFSESLKGGDILFMDLEFFIHLFLDLMYKEDMKEIWEVINEFLMEESFVSLCRHLLILLDEKDLCVFLELSRTYLNPKMELMNLGPSSSHWFEVVLSKFSISGSMDQILLLNAVITRGRQLLRLIHEEEAHEEKVKMQDVVVQIRRYSSNPSSLASLVKECLKTKSINSIKWLGLQAFAHHYRLAEELRTPESLELVLSSNEITFRKSEKYPLLYLNGFSGDSESDLDEKPSLRVKRRKKEKRQKKRKRHLDRDNNNNDSYDLDLSNNSGRLQNEPSSWFLSTDGYSTAWSMVDLPEYLSMYCFSTWVKWILGKWKNAD